VRSVLAVLAVGVLLVLVGAGCGGIDKGKLESAIKSQTNDQLKANGQPESVSSVSCDKAGDSYHYTCKLLKDDGSTFLTVSASCTKGGTCSWKRA
jgi:hypothetical protein